MKEPIYATSPYIDLLPTCRTYTHTLSSISRASRAKSCSCLITWSSSYYSQCCTTVLHASVMLGYVSGDSAPPFPNRCSRVNRGICGPHPTGRRWLIGVQLDHGADNASRIFFGRCAVSLRFSPGKRDRAVVRFLRQREARVRNERVGMKGNFLFQIRITERREIFVM